MTSDETRYLVPLGGAGQIAYIYVFHTSYYFGSKKSCQTHFCSGPAQHQPRMASCIARKYLTELSSELNQHDENPGTISCKITVGVDRMKERKDEKEYKE